MTVLGDSLTTIVVALGALLLVLLVVLLMRKFNGRERVSNLRQRGVHLAKRFAMRFAMRFSTPLTSFDIKLQVGEAEGLPDAADAKPASSACQAAAPVTLPPAQELLNVEGPIDDEPPVRKPNHVAKDSEKSPESPLSAGVSPESDTRNSGRHKRKHKHRKHERNSRTTDVTNSTARSKSKLKHRNADVPKGRRPVTLSGEASGENTSPGVVSSPVEARSSPTSAAHRGEAAVESAPLDRGSEGAGPVAVSPPSKKNHEAHDPAVEEDRRGASQASRASPCASHPRRLVPDKPSVPPELDIFLEEPAAIDVASRGTVEHKYDDKHTEIAKPQLDAATTGTVAEPFGGTATRSANSAAVCDAAKTGRPLAAGHVSAGKSRDSDDLSVQELRAMFVRRASLASQSTFQSQRHNADNRQNPLLGVVSDGRSTIDTAAKGLQAEMSEAKHNNQHRQIAKSPAGGTVSGATASTSVGCTAPPSAAPASDTSKSVPPSAADQSSGSRSKSSDDLNVQELRAMFVRRASSASRCSLPSQRRNSDKPRAPHNLITATLQATSESVPKKP
ncbi:uncharacterized protein [Dermacentor andersoni]|uniref:uncharacterized protein n=1 Tax=Dermacentor andersoni TaxID=34620 RepID=UPI002416EAD4|nr:uncharacterized protein LOC129383355 [Dermacentor andersoni]